MLVDISWLIMLVIKLVNNVGLKLVNNVGYQSWLIMLL